MTRTHAYVKLFLSWKVGEYTLDKEEFRVKLEEINNLVEQQDYKGAMSVVDSIDWRRVKNVRTLCVVGEIYAANKRYEDSKEIFLLAYHRAPIGKNILYRLIEVSLKMDEIDEAMDFYEEYLEVAPNDNTQFILKYKIYKARNASIDTLIKILEDYKEREFTERWSYELVKLYYKAGDKKKCSDLCSEMVLWFSDGKYVAKALELKSHFSDLTDMEKKIYRDHLRADAELNEKAALSRSSRGSYAKEKKNSEEESPAIESIAMDEKDINNAESLQEKISKGIRDIFSGKKKESEPDAGSSEEENEQEEMIRDLSSRESSAPVPELEPEDIRPGKTVSTGEGKVDIPSLKIPDEMKAMQGKPELKKVASEFDENDESLKEDSEDSQDSSEQNREFNLEDTILAAATAQGIEIPENSPEQETENEEAPEEEDLTEEAPESEQETETEAEDQKKSYEVPSLEEEEFLSEELLQEAEDEFMNGPAGKKEQKTAKENLLNFQKEINKILEDDPNQEDYRKGKQDEDSIQDLSDEDFIDEDDLEEEELSEEEELERFIESRDPRKQNPEELIPREESLSDEEIKLFTYFVKVPGMKEQLIDTLIDVQMAAADKTSKTGNIIVMGGRETGKTRLISSLIPAICSELNLEASKVAYVFADQINNKDISRIVNKLAGGFLVIEDANQLSPQAAEQLDKAMEFRTDGLTVIVEDEKIGMRKFMARYPKLAKKFTSTINIPVFTNDELVNFARIYTKENGYIIDQMGMLALYNLISANQKADEPMNIGVVKNIIDNAITKSQGGIRKLKRNISKKHTDHDGYVILYEKDFS